MKNNNYGVLFLGAIVLGLVFCLLNNDKQERAQERQREREERQERREAYERERYRTQVHAVEYVQPAPRVSTQFNWSFGNGRSGFNVSYNMPAPVCRPCYVVKEKRYFVQPMSTYTYYF
jgi:outer membrane biogenesis lipoprotein LolB